MILSIKILSTRKLSIKKLSIMTISIMTAEHNTHTMTLSLMIRKAEYGYAKYLYAVPSC
jgi:hypothetical protein